MEEDEDVVATAFSCASAPSLPPPTLPGTTASFIIHKMRINNKYSARLLGLHELTDKEPRMKLIIKKCRLSSLLKIG